MSAVFSLSQSRPPIGILGVPFDNVTTADSLAIIGEMIASRRPHYAATANVDFAVQASEDVELRRILFDAHLVLCDGMPLVWASRFLGNPLPERVTGSDMVPRLLAEAESKGWRVFFLGGTPESVATAAEKTRAKHPGIQLVGAYSPPFKPLLEMDHEDIVRRIREAKPDLLFVAFGCPKQEKWISMHYRETGVPLSIGVGATIDFLAGTFKRAPVWMQRTGTEWMFRMAQEPRRLAKRYGKGFFVFGAAIGKQWWQLRSRPKPQVAAARASVKSDLPGITIIQAPARLDAAEAGRFCADWERLVVDRNVILHLADTEFVDSTGIGTLIRLRKRAREAGRAFVLAGVRAQVEAALRLMKLECFFPMAQDLTSARLLIAQETKGLSVAASECGGELLVRWQGEVTAANAIELGRSTESELTSVPPGGTAAVDLAGVGFVDSAGVGQMVRLKKRLWQREVKLIFANATPAVQNVLRMTRLDDYLLGKAA